MEGAGETAEIAGAEAADAGETAEISGAEAAAAGETEEVAAEAGAAAEVQPAEPAENPLWTACKERPHEFDCWMALVPTLEKAGQASAIREGYEGLLKEFPLCYGYWEKYARLELKESGKAAQLGIFDRGVTAVNCVELWVLYCTAAMEGIRGGDAATTAAAGEVARKIFDRAIDAVGAHWGAANIWESYCKYESERPDGGDSKVAVITYRASVIKCDFAERFHTKLVALVDAASEDVITALVDELPEASREAVSSAGSGCTLS